jgi:outer membrane protein OmpA-like peptidoglycan-associated protein
MSVKLPYSARHLAVALGLLLLLLTLAAPVQAQTRGDRRLFQKAMSMQSRQRFVQAAKLHEKYLLKRSDWEAKWNLSYCYGKMGRIDDQERLLTDLVFTRPDEPEFKLRLAELLKRQGKYDSAKLWYEKYASQSPDSLEGKRLAALCETAMAMKKDSLGYQVTRLAGINSPADDLLPYLQATKFYFISNRSGSHGLWGASRASDGAFGKVETTKKPVDDPMAGGLTKGVNLSLTKPRGPASAVPEGAASAAKRMEVPSMTSELGADYLCVSPNGKIKVMALSEYGGYGGADLFVSYYENGAWSEPVNLGPEVNGPSNEEFPFLSNDSTCYFSSDRNGGMGGYDVYSAERIGDRWINLRHEGAPLNSSYNEIGFCMVPGQPLGYFASDRSGGAGGYDIMNFRRFKLLEIQVVDAETYLPKANVKVEIVDINQRHHSYRTNAEGRLTHVMRVGQDVFAQFFHPDYIDQSQNISLRLVGYDQNLRLTVPMEAIQRNVLEGTVVDARSQTPLEGVTVRIVGGKDLRGYTNKKGGYSQVLQPETFYRGIFYLPGYVPEIIEFKTGAEAHPPALKRDIALRKGGFHYLEGRTVDTERDIVVGDATIHFVDSKSLQEVKTLEVGPDGMFYKVLEADRDYTIIASKGKYLSARMDVPRATDRADTLLKNLELVPLMPDKVIKTVYFPYRSSSIDEAGFKEVAEVIYLLKSNPTIGLELTAFTDSRGGAEYNKILSQQRADALAAYMVAQGIESSRIRSIGKGEEELFNNCQDGVTCSEELHSQNRRAEIRIVRLE